MHYREGKVKREHSIIKDLLPLLHKVGQHPEVTTIVPGRIKPITGNYPTPKLELKVKTASGFKCIAKSSRSVQEVFVVVVEGAIDSIIEKLQKQKLLS